MSYAAGLPPYERRDQHSRRVYRRRRLIVLPIVVLVVLALLYVAAIAIAPLPAASAVSTAGVTTIKPAAVAPAWPATGGAAVGIMGQDALLAEHGSETPVPIASMTKTITALVVLDKKPIANGTDGPTITFTSQDVDILHQVWAENGSWAKVSAGEQLTERQALTAMLLPSANNYAISIATWAFGSVPAYLAATKSWLSDHGFSNTTVTDPSGLDAGSISNMSDLVGIGKLAIADPVLSGIVATQTAQLPQLGEIDNSNKLLGSHGINGIKTGFTDEAGHCLLFSASVTIWGTTRTLVGVMIGQPGYDDLWSGVPPLLKSIEDGFHTVDLTASGPKSFGSYTTAWGQSTKLVPASKATAQAWSDTPITVTVDASGVAAGAKGQDAGTVSYSVGGKTVSARLVTSSAITKPDFAWRFAHPGALF